MFNFVMDLIGANKQKDAAEDAARAQVDAAQLGVDETRRQFDLLRESLLPYMTAGQEALATQQSMLGLSGPEAYQQQLQSIEASPIYQDLVRQGEEALLQNASATGGLRGGNTQAALAQFRPALLSQELARRYQGLGGLTSLGQSSAAGVGAQGLGAAANIANLYGQQGAANAGGILGQANARNTMFGLPSKYAGMLAGFGSQNDIFGNSTGNQKVTATDDLTDFLSAGKIGGF